MRQLCGNEPAGGDRRSGGRSDRARRFLTTGLVRFRPRPRPAGCNDGRGRLDDRLGGVHRLGRHRPPGWVGRLAAGGLGGERAAHRRRGAVVRRACRDDARGGRAVRLPARGVLAVLGVPLRLDAVPRDPDRDDRGGRGGVLPLSGCPGPSDLASELDRPAGGHLRELRGQPLHAAARGDPHDGVAHVDEHEGVGARQAHPERLHLDQNARGDGADRDRSGSRLEQCRDPRQLHRRLDASRRRTDRAGLRLRRGGHGGLRAVRTGGRAVRRAGRVSSPRTPGTTSPSLEAR